MTANGAPPPHENQASARVREDTLPSRGVALLLAALGGASGIGQFYLGQSRRAMLWLILPSFCLLLFSLAFQDIVDWVGYGPAFVLGFVALFGAWLASFVDLFLIARAKLQRVKLAELAAFWVLGLSFTLIVRWCVRAYVVEAFKISSSAMQPTLLVGDHVMTDKRVFARRKPRRGEVIIFRHPEHREEDYVERVIAIAGDLLEVRHGRPWVNGWEVPHCVVGQGKLPEDASTSVVPVGEVDLEFLDRDAYLVFFDEASEPRGREGPYRVGPNELWALGDNRNDSYDSRAWFDGRGGGVPLEQVVARPLFRWLSFTTQGSVDWARFGSAVHAPLLPHSMQALQPGLTACLQKRPSREQATPPSPRP